MFKNPCEPDNLMTHNFQMQFIIASLLYHPPNVTAFQTRNTKFVCDKLALMCCAPCLDKLNWKVEKQEFPDTDHVISPLDNTRKPEVGPENCRTHPQGRRQG